jgi:hypothetical protein
VKTEPASGASGNAGAVAARAPGAVLRLAEAAVVATPEAATGVLAPAAPVTPTALAPRIATAIRLNLFMATSPIGGHIGGRARRGGQLDEGPMRSRWRGGPMADRLKAGDRLTAQPRRRATD